MSNALEQLFFTITLLDKVSGPARGVCESFQNMQRQGRDAFQLMGKGALGVTAAAVGLNAFSGPARDFSMAIGEVASLGASTEELDTLGKASMKFAMRFGGDATAIVRSAYDIQSAIPGLTNGALAAFTTQGALLAKATKADAATITSYTGTMYSIFEKDAKRIGEAKWIEQMAGKTAEAVKMFKTTGPAMAAAFSNLGSTGQIAGVSMDEQLAVLGTLQSTMGGANAGTAYKGFIAKLSAGQKELGLSFKGSDGQLLPIYEILMKIRGTVGTLDKDQQIAKLTTAFGETGAQAVLNLMDKTEALKGSIGSLSAVQDSSGAAKMAEAMTDPYAKFQSTLSVLRISLGQGVLPVVNLVLGVISKIMSVAVWFVNTIPGLKYLIGGVIIAITALTMAMSSFYLVIGGKRLLNAFWEEMKLLWGWVVKNTAATNSMTGAQRVNAIMQMLWSKAVAKSTLLTMLAAKAQWLWTAVTKKGAFATATKVIWDKTMALCNLKLAFSSSAAATATTAQTTALSWSTVQTKLAALWSGILKVSMIALKLAMLVGVVPAAIATAAAMAVCKGAMALFNGVLAIGKGLLIAFRTSTLAVGGAMLWQKTAMLAGSAAVWVMNGGLIAAAAGAWAFTVAMLANPIIWIVIGVVALIGALAALVIYWDDVTNAALVCWNGIVDAAKWCWELLSTGVIAYFNFWLGIWSAVGDAALICWNGIVDAAKWCWELLSGGASAYLDFWLGIWSAVWQGASAVFGKIAAVWDNTVGKIGKAWDWITASNSVTVEKNIVSPVVTGAAALPVPDRKLGQIISTSAPGRQPEPVLADLVEARNPDVPPGGVRSSTVNNNTRNYKVDVYAPNGLSPAQLEEFLILQA